MAHLSHWVLNVIDTSLPRLDTALPKTNSIDLDSILLPSIKNAVGSHRFTVQVVSVLNANEYNSLFSLESQIVRWDPTAQVITE